MMILAWLLVGLTLAAGYGWSARLLREQSWLTVLLGLALSVGALTLIMLWEGLLGIPFSLIGIALPYFALMLPGWWRVRPSLPRIPSHWEKRLRAADSAGDQCGGAVQRRLLAVLPRRYARHLPARRAGHLPDASARPADRRRQPLPRLSDPGPAQLHLCLFRVRLGKRVSRQNHCDSAQPRLYPGGLRPRQKAARRAHRLAGGAGLGADAVFQPLGIVRLRRSADGFLLHAGGDLRAAPMTIQRSLVDAALAGVLIGLAAWTKNAALIGIVLLALWLGWCWLNKRIGWREVALSLGLCALVAAPWYIRNLIGAGFLIPATAWTDQAQRTLESAFVLITHPENFGAPGWLMLAGVVAALPAAIRRRKPGAILLLTLDAALFRGVVAVCLLRSALSAAVSAAALRAGRRSAGAAVGVDWYRLAAARSDRRDPAHADPDRADCPAHCRLQGRDPPQSLDERRRQARRRRALVSFRTAASANTRP